MADHAARRLPGGGDERTISRAEVYAIWSALERTAAQLERGPLLLRPKSASWRSYANRWRSIAVANEPVHILAAPATRLPWLGHPAPEEAVKPWTPPPL